VRAFVKDPRARTVTPHIARNERRKPDGTLPRSSAIDRCTTRHPGYAISLRIRKRIEEAFGWIKAAAYTLIRLPKLMRAA
jgi:hypothetical protein